jgi:uncharacterized membrane protein YgdD (TMEM256/DUF423 family)
MEKAFFLLGALLAALAVALGAFGAHALKARLPTERQETFETGVRYQMYHSLGLLLAAFAAGRWPGSNLPAIAGWLFLAGIFLFSGSLYTLVLGEKRWLGAITPFGGLAFIAGWLCLAVAAL